MQVGRISHAGYLKGFFGEITLYQKKRLNVNRHGDQTE